MLEFSPSEVVLKPPCIHKQDVEIDVPNRFEGRTSFPSENLPRQSLEEIQILASAPTVISKHSLELTLVHLAPPSLKRQKICKVSTRTHVLANSLPDPLGSFRYSGFRCVMSAFCDAKNASTNAHPVFNWAGMRTPAGSPTPCAFSSSPVLRLIAKIGPGGLRTGNRLSNPQYCLLLLLSFFLVSLFFL